MQPQPSKPRHGGTRQGAGRKAAYGEPTKTVRVPQSLVPLVVGYLDAMRRPSANGADSSGLRPIVLLRATIPVPSLRTYP